jgi:glycine/D-amino acid oxidase-like deaminating enzyme
MHRGLMRMSEWTGTIWKRGYQPIAIPTLPDKVSGDIAIIGSGVAGLTAAYILTRAGFSVFIIEAVGVGAGMTGLSTAHISSAIDGGWRKLVARVGATDASIIATSYRAGIEKIHRLATCLPDDCDFLLTSGELLGGTHDRSILIEEQKAARLAGMEVGEIQTAGSAEGYLSLAFPHQGCLHPLKYVGGLARALIADGVHIYQATLKGFQENKHGVQLQLSNDQRVVCRALILAHHLSLEKAYPHVKISRKRSYVIAADCLDAESADTITWDLAHPYHYTRIAYADKQRFIIVGGADHPTDTPADPAERFSLLERWMRERFPAAGETKYRWWGDLKQTSDSLAVMGLLPDLTNVYAMDGDTGLGFNHAMLGAEIIRDHLLHRSNPCAKLFDPARISFTS